MRRRKPGVAGLFQRYPFAVDKCPVPHVIPVPNATEWTCRGCGNHWFDMRDWPTASMKDMPSAQVGEQVSRLMTREAMRLTYLSMNPYWCGRCGTYHIKDQHVKPKEEEEWTFTRAI